MANKNDLIKHIENENNIKGTEATAAVNMVLEGVIGLLAEESENNEPDKNGVVAKLQLAGFGNFEVKRRDAREHRNPQTGENVLKPAHNAPTFKPGKAMKEHVN